MIEVMDPEVRFFLYSRWLPRFLMVATAVLVCVFMLLWWQERQQPVETVPVLPVAYSFSSRATPSEVIVVYGNDSRILHDIEAIPTIKELFFSNPVVLPNTPETIAEALNEVRYAVNASSSNSALHVRSASFYIGNLLVLPNLTLHAVLSEEGTGATARLLDTALADVRSGAVKLGQYFDIAPPSFYDQTLVSQLTYYAPSFPSLTVAEAATVLQLLAILNPLHARLYEAQLETYLSEVIASGSHWSMDVTYGMRFARAMVAAMQESPSYQSLISAAAEEWQTRDVTTRTSYLWQPAPFRFFSALFIYPNVMTVRRSDDLTRDTADDTSTEKGMIYLTLRDERLPAPVARPYAYNTETKMVLPTDLDLSPRQQPLLGSALSQVLREETGGRSIFLSGEPAPWYDRSRWYLTNRVFVREGDTVSPIAALVSDTQVYYSALDWQEDSMIAFVRLPAEGKAVEGEVGVATTVTGASGPIVLGSGSDVTLVDEDTVLYVQSGQVYEWKKEQSESRVITAIPAPTSETERRQIEFFEEQSTLLLQDTLVDPFTMIPKTEVSLVELTATEERFTPGVKVTLTGGVVHDVELSPVGDQIAFVVTPLGGIDQVRLLLFDINSGIISQDTLLEGFGTSRVTIDGWSMQSTL